MRRVHTRGGIEVEGEVGLFDAKVLYEFVLFSL